MKKFLLMLLLLAFVVTKAQDFGLACKPGYITDEDNTFLFNLDCTHKRCYFDVTLPNGLYNYYSADRQDSSTLLVTDTGVFKLGTQSNDLVIVNDSNE